jgi:formylglycine-generating enzyme required for sulfatase activity
VISDTPSASGTSSFTVQVMSGGAEATRELTLTALAAGSEGLGIGFGPEQFELIPAGTFQMGDQSGVGQSDELPVHTVTITQSFYMQKTEVTQAQWLSVMGDEPSAASSCGETCPVESVQEIRILAFISTLNARDPGKDYRLPTEAEWEYAARAGTTGDFGGTGNVDEMGWYARNSGTALHLVAQLEPNGWGLYDMHGNVHEYVQDWYASDYYGSSPAEDPPGPSVGSYRALRGGSWFDPAENLRSASRLGPIEIARVRHGVGFRLARSH